MCCPTSWIQETQGYCWRQGLCWKDYINCTSKEQQGPFGSKKRGESCVYCRRKKQRKWGGREVCRVRTFKGKDFVSLLEINQFEVSFCVNVTQKNLHNFFQSNKSYPQLSAALSALLSVLLVFLSVLFLYSLPRQPLRRTAHLGRFSLRYQSSIKGTTHATAPQPALQCWCNKHDPKGQHRALPAPSNLGW